jgi:hypothetical protein
VCGGNIETTAVKIYKVSVRVYFESGAKLPTVVMCRVVTEPNVSVLFRGELENVRCDFIMTAEGKMLRIFFYQLCF